MNLRSIKFSETEELRMNPTNSITEKLNANRTCNYIQRHIKKRIRKSSSKNRPGRRGRTSTRERAKLWCRRDLRENLMRERERYKRRATLGFLASGVWFRVFFLSYPFRFCHVTWLNSDLNLTVHDLFVFFPLSLLTIYIYLGKEKII